jgi:alpha-N-acetylglucosamine transferase
MIVPLHRQGVILQQVHKINSPQAETHQARKFQYTKLHLWSMDGQFQKLVHLDLDTLLLEKVDELFRCGVFCASMRHSDLFNSGVFVLKPNKTVSSSFNDVHLFDGFLDLQRHAGKSNDARKL